MKQRLFVGIPLPHDAVASLQTAATIVRREDSRWAGEKWVAPENIHITLSFLGDVDEAILACLVRELGSVVSSSESVTLTPAALSAVPNTRNCRMLWASFIDENGAAATLATSIRRGTSGLGIAGDEKPFRAHATLCRARRAHPLDGGVLGAAEQAFLADAPTVSDPTITLYSSRLTPRGPRYGEIASWHTMGECSG